MLDTWNAGSRDALENMERCNCSKNPPKKMAQNTIGGRGFLLEFLPKGGGVVTRSQNPLGVVIRSKKWSIFLLSENRVFAKIN